MIFLVVGSSGCASWYGYKYAEIPTIEAPVTPEKPAIKSQVIEKDKTFYVSYTINDAMKLYEYLIRMEAHEEKLEYRIKIMNDLIQRR
jgi:hypothetical protein